MLPEAAVVQKAVGTDVVAFEIHTAESGSQCLLTQVVALDHREGGWQEADTRVQFFTWWKKLTVRSKCQAGGEGGRERQDGNSHGMTLPPLQLGREAGFREL